MDVFRPPFDASPYRFTGARLTEIAFPLGGIGTGCVSLDGRGGLRDWEIFHRPNKNSLMEATFPALWVREEGQEPRALVVQGPGVRDWTGEGQSHWSLGQGKFFKQMDGLPGFDAVEFDGTLPFARVRFHKAGFPLDVEPSALKGSPTENLVKFTFLVTGMRIVEVTGLTWGGVNLKQKTILIFKQLARMRKKLVLKPLKTEKSMRTMPFVGHLLNVVRAERNRQVDEDYENELDLVFLNPWGRPFRSGGTSTTTYTSP